MATERGWGTLLVLYPETPIHPDGSVSLKDCGCISADPRVVVAPRLGAASLTVYDSASWQKQLTFWDALPDVRAEGLALLNAVRTRAHLCELDSRGVLEIPATLQAVAGLTVSVLPVRSSDHLELWNLDLFADFQRRRRVRAGASTYPTVAERDPRVAIPVRKETGAVSPAGER